MSSVMDCGKSSRLDDEEIERLSRQLIVRGWGLPAQERLQKSILTVSPDLPLAAAYLRAAGAYCLLRPGCDKELTVCPDFALLTPDDLTARKRLAKVTLVCRPDGTVTDENTGQVYSSRPGSTFGSRPATGPGSASRAAEVFAALFVLRQFMPSR